MSAHETVQYLKEYLTPDFLSSRGRTLDDVGLSPSGTIYVIFRIDTVAFLVGVDFEWVDGDFGSGKDYANYISEIVGEPNGGTPNDFVFDTQGVGWLGSVPNWRVARD